ADIARGEVGEEGILAGPAVAMAVVALRLAAEQPVAHLLLRGELRLARKHRIELRGEGRYLGRGLIAGDGLRHLIEGRGGPAAIQFAEMDRHRIVGGWRSRLVTDLFHIVRPRNREGLPAPNAFEQGAIRPLRGAVDRTGDVGQAHFY